MERFPLSPELWAVYEKDVIRLTKKDSAPESAVYSAFFDHSGHQYAMYLASECYLGVTAAFLVKLYGT